MNQIGYLAIVVFCLYSVGATEFETAPNFFGQFYAPQRFPRGLFADSAGDLLVVNRDTSSIVAIREVPLEDGSTGLLETTLVSHDPDKVQLTHSIIHHKGYLYASSDTTVYRWQYVPGSLEIKDAAEIIVAKMPEGGNHITRTLAFDKDDLLYVSVGSEGNVDPDSKRARVVRFDLSKSFPIQWTAGEIFADGTRNDVGLAFDKSGMLWAVENGLDRLVREDLGGDIHNGNPAEEIHRFDGPIGEHFGYPYCWTSYNLTGYPAGTQFADPRFMKDGTHTDEWCRNPKNNRLPHPVLLPPHTAPLGIQFYEKCAPDVPGSFPCDMVGDAFVALHGSWNSDHKVGYSVIHLPFTKSPPFHPTGVINNIIYEPSLGSCNRQCFRPVNAVFNTNGHLFISTGSQNEIFKVTYGVPPTHVVAL